MAVVQRARGWGTNLTDLVLAKTCTLHFDKNGSSISGSHRLEIKTLLLSLIFTFWLSLPCLSHFCHFPEFLDFVFFHGYLVFCNIFDPKMGKNDDTQQNPRKMLRISGMKKTCSKMKAKMKHEQVFVLSDVSLWL